MLSCMNGDSIRLSCVDNASIEKVKEVIQATGAVNFCMFYNKFRVDEKLKPWN